MPQEIILLEVFPRRCSRTYGVAPCTAAVGVTGNRKCFNSPRTCQDVANYAAVADGSNVLTFAEPADDLLKVHGITNLIAASIIGFSTRPQEARPGENLGVREQVNISLADVPHSDVGLDPYLISRSYNPYLQGTLNGKLMARWPVWNGFECAVARGTADTDASTWERRWYVVDNIDGPDSDGTLQLVLKDVLALADTAGVNYPPVSPGVLLADISESDTTATLTPTGIGALYPASGTASMGDERVSYTRSGDSLTLTRHPFDAKEQKAGTTFQMAAAFVSTPAWTILNTLFTAAGVPATYLQPTVWQAEITAAGTPSLYTTEILKPTDIRTLLNELMVEAALYQATDLVNRKIIIKVLRSRPPTHYFNDDNIINGSFRVKALRDKRASIAITYYGQVNGTKKKEEGNYRAAVASVADDPAAALENLPTVIRKVMSRWITSEPQAISSNAIILERYTLPPREVEFTTPLIAAPNVNYGDIISVENRYLNDDTGARTSIFAQVTSIDRRKGILSITGEEARYVTVSYADEHLILIDEDRGLSTTLKALHDSLYLPATPGTVIRLKISAIAGGLSGFSGYTLVQDYLASDGVTVIIEFTSTGYLMGAGGKGQASDGSPAGGNGRPALQVLGPCEIYGAKIYGGGGGGGRALLPDGVTYQAGAGGAGYYPGAIGDGYQGGVTAATAFTPGGASHAGDGGVHGAAGGSGQTPGAGGNAIDGISLITFTGPTPDIRGATT